MNETPQPLQAAEPARTDQVPSSPLRLRQAREAAGLHVAVLAASLKVPVKRLEALEAGRYEELPDLTFARALAAGACRQLKIDPAPVLEQIPAAHLPRLGAAVRALDLPFKPASGLAPWAPAAWFARPVFWIAAAFLLAALLLAFWPRAPLSPLPQTLSTEPLPAPVPPDAAALPIPPEPQAPLQTAPTSPLPAIAPLVEPPPPRPAGPAAAAGTEAALLRLRASGESWVEVINGAGSVLVRRVLKAGDVMDFSAAPPYQVVIGRADAVEVTLRGQPFNLRPHARSNVARFEVK